jgi:hypothetical protein
MEYLSGLKIARHIRCRAWTEACDDGYLPALREAENDMYQFFTLLMRARTGFKAGRDAAAGPDNPNTGIVRRW